MAAAADEAPAVEAYIEGQLERSCRPPALSWTDLVTSLRARNDLEARAFIHYLGRTSRSAIELQVLHCWADEEGQVFIRVRFGPERPVHQADAAGGPNESVHDITLLAIQGSSIFAQPLGAWAEAES